MSVCTIRELQAMDVMGVSCAELKLLNAMTPTRNAEQ
jgi:hypothetical protein